MRYLRHFICICFVVLIVIQSCSIDTTAENYDVKLIGNSYIVYENNVYVGNYTGWAIENGKRIYVKNGSKACSPTLVNSTMFDFSSDGTLKGKYSGFIRDNNNIKAYKNGKLITNKWIKRADDKYSYARNDGNLCIGWSDIVKKNGKYSFFDSNGIWDGKVYWNKIKSNYSFEEKLSKTVCVSLYINDCIYTDSNYNSKLIGKYVKLDIPYCVGEILSVGDEIILSTDTNIKYTKNGTAYLYLSCLSKPEVNKSKESILFYKINLFNSILVGKKGSLKLNMMAQQLRFDINEIVSTLGDNDNGLFLSFFDGKPTYYYGLFGGYNQYLEEENDYIFHNNMSFKDCWKLLKTVYNQKIHDHTGEPKQWFGIMSNGVWISAKIINIE